MFLDEITKYSHRGRGERDAIRACTLLRICCSALLLVCHRARLLIRYGVRLLIRYRGLRLVRCCAQNLLLSLHWLGRLDYRNRSSFAQGVKEFPRTLGEVNDHDDGDYEDNCEYNYSDDRRNRKVAATAFTAVLSFRRRVLARFSARV